MTATLIRKKLKDYISIAANKKVKAIYTMLEEEIEDNDKWSDKNFVAEIERRTHELESAKIKGVTWEEVKRKAYQSARRKKYK